MHLYSRHATVVVLMVSTLERFLQSFLEKEFYLQSWSWMEGKNEHKLGISSSHFDDSCPLLPGYLQLVENLELVIFTTFAYFSVCSVLFCRTRRKQRRRKSLRMDLSSWLVLSGTLDDRKSYPIYSYGTGKNNCISGCSVMIRIYCPLHLNR